MDFTEIFKNESQSFIDHQKSKKIYLLNSRKSYNTQRKKLNELLQINSQILQKNSQISLKGSIKRYLKSDKTQQSSIRYSYDNRSKAFNIWEKQKDAKVSIISNPYLESINTIFNTEKTQKVKKFESLQVNRDKIQGPTNFQLIEIQQSCGSLPSLNKKSNQSQMMPKKKLSYSYPKKRRSISFSDESNQTPIQLKNRLNQPQYDFSPREQEALQFLKNGKVNGQKIYNLLMEKQKQKIQNFRQQDSKIESRLKTSPSEANHIIEKYYSLIKNVDYGRMTKHSGKKAIKSHYDKLKTKKGNQKKKPSRIDQVHTQTFIKVQSMFSAKNKTQVDQ